MTYPYERRTLINSMPAGLHRGEFIGLADATVRPELAVNVFRIVGYGLVTIPGLLILVNSDPVMPGESCSLRLGSVSGGTIVRGRMIAARPVRVHGLGGAR